MKTYACMYMNEHKRKIGLEIIGISEIKTADEGK